MEIQKQNASLPPARPRTRTSIADTVSELSIRTLHLLMDGMVHTISFTIQFLKSCRSEASYCGNYVVGLYLIPNDELH